MPATDHPEVVVVGGGPAGSTAAAVLARAGRRVLLVERQLFPRFHIGESLLPASARVLRATGVWDQVRKAGFVEKHGASFYSATEELGRIDFSSAPQVADPVSFHVPRDRFDQILLEHAAAAGAEVVQGSSARALDLTGERVRLTVEGADQREVEAQFLIDASGQAGFVTRRLGLRRPDRRLRNVAVHSQFDHVGRPSGDRAGDIRVVSRRDLEWIWLIPLSPERTSVGVVLPAGGEHAHDSREEGWLEDYLSSVPVLRSCWRGARRVEPVRRDADFAYSTERYAGDRWLAAGDAGAFLDPVFSTGVHLALESGLEAAGEALRALERGDFSASAFVRYERRQRARYKFFRRFTDGFYSPAFRDLLLEAEGPLGVMEAVVEALAGLSRLTPLTRLRLELFFLLVATQNLFAIAPRRHLPPAESSFSG